MRRACLIVLFAMPWLHVDTLAMAQMWPRPHRSYGNYDGYGYDFGVTYNLSSAGNASRYVAQADRMMGERAAMQQQAALQSGIRSTMAADAQARQQAILGQQQAGRDWWFQVQQQQVAQRQAMGSRSMGIPSAGFESAPQATEPPVAMDVIQWLPVLRNPRFAQERAMIEAPYRRNPTGLSIPTADDYKNMIETTGRMKETLKQMTAEISAQEYLDAEAFLDQLATEARQRLEKAQPKT